MAMMHHLPKRLPAWRQDRSRDARRLGLALCCLWVFGQVLAWSHFSLFEHTVDGGTGHVIHLSHHEKPDNGPGREGGGHAEECRVLGLLTQGGLQVANATEVEGAGEAVEDTNPLVLRHDLRNPIEIVYLSPSHSPPPA
jgi:hypothetical protein